MSSITQQSVALPAVNAYSALISLLGVNFDKPVTVGFSAAEVAGDTFRILGTLDSAAVDDTNATELGTVAGFTGLPLPPDLVTKLGGWPYVFVQRLTGTNAGNFFVSGEASSAAVAVSTATPAAGAFSAVLNLTGFGSDPVRIGGSNSQLAGDTFDVYVTQIAGAVSAAGCYLAGRITGGGSDNGKVNSLLLCGWPYALVQRVSTGTATAGTIIACGVSPATGNAPDSVAPLPNTDVRRDGSGGALNVYEKLGPDGATFSAGGRVRLTSAAEVAVAMKALGAGDVAIITKDGADGFLLGDATAAARIVLQTKALGTVAVKDSTGTTLFLVDSAGQINFGVGPVRFAAIVGGPQIDQINPAAGTTGEDMTFTAQRGDGAGQHGGNIVFRGGGAVNGAARGNVGLVATPAAQYGAEGAVFIGGVTTEPTSNPVGGLLATATGAGAFLTVRTSGGLACRIGDGGLGFFNKTTTPQAQVATYTLNYVAAGSRTLDDYTNTPTGIDNAQAGAVYATNADLVLAANQIKDLSAVVKQLLTDVRGYGLTA